MSLKIIIILLVLSLLASCSTTKKMLDGKNKLVYFEANNSVFDDSLQQSQSISYTDLFSVRNDFINTVPLLQNEVATAFISRPTFFLKYDKFLVFPQEHIYIRKYDTVFNYYSFEVKNNLIRNNELSFFQKLNSITPYPVIKHNEDASLNNILKQREEFQKEAFIYATCYKKNFDSLVNAYHVSNKFKEIAQTQILHTELKVMFGFYRQYADVLTKYNLLNKFYLERIDELNSINNIYELEAIAIEFNKVLSEVLPLPITKLKTAEEFNKCYELIKINFKNLSKDYFLSRLLYYANKNRIFISEEKLNSYYSECYNKEFKDLVKKLYNSKENQISNSNAINTNLVLTLNGKKTVDITNVINKHKGKIIVLDFWASWCAPCIEEIPYVKKLLTEYNKHNVAFIQITFDKEIQPWQKTIYSQKLTEIENYKIINSINPEIINKYNINSIPRYMLIDKDGKIIDADAPRPSDPKLKTLLDKLLKE
ncbi:MAG: TlpA family protein disulfide reductase [Bacteroidetes bacterium]|nr:TlpA family protein disulfide reductase [Bacteroidota bacterium]